MLEQTLDLKQEMQWRTLEQTKPHPLTIAVDTVKRIVVRGVVGGVVKAAVPAVCLKGISAPESGDCPVPSSPSLQEVACS